MFHAELFPFHILHCLGDQLGHALVSGFVKVYLIHKVFLVVLSSGGGNCADAASIIRPLNTKLVLNFISICFPLLFLILFLNFSSNEKFS